MQRILHFCLWLPSAYRRNVYNRLPWFKHVQINFVWVRKMKLAYNLPEDTNNKKVLPYMAKLKHLDTIIKTKRLYAEDTRQDWKRWARRNQGERVKIIRKILAQK